MSENSEKTIVVDPNVVMLREADVAAKLDVTASGLQKWRRRKTGPPFIRLGRSIRYPSDQLDQWLEAQRVTAKPARKRA